MLEKLFAIFGLAILCSAWAWFQIWIKQYNPNTVGSKCSACKHEDCSTTT